MTDELLKVDCPTCHKSTIWSKANAYRPFCCERCKLIDLGEWASESHRIASNEPLDEFDLQEIESLYND